MKPLVDLHPKWAALLRPKSGEGVEFDCPNCTNGHRLVAWFFNPVDGQMPADWQQPKWSRFGETFEELTVAPSIQYPCFHGWIEKGQVIDISEAPGFAEVIENGQKKLVALSPIQWGMLTRSGAAPELTDTI